MTLTVGSLCTGYAGLDLAVEAVFGAEMVWLCEYDDNASTILAKHFPDVPNHRDLTTLDWTTLEPVDIISAGYPCQPFSHAGNRKGSEDERHLWPFIADAVRVLRPRWVVLENVAGHLSLGLGSVLGDLAQLGYDTQWRCVRASDVGAPHGRKRIFILATDTRARPAADTDSERRRSADTGDAQSERARLIPGRPALPAADTDDEPGTRDERSPDGGRAGARASDQSAADTDSGSAVGQLPRGLRQRRPASSTDVRRVVRDDDGRGRRDDTAADTDSASSEARLDTGHDSSVLRQQPVGPAATAADAEPVSHGQRRRARRVAREESGSPAENGHKARPGAASGGEEHRSRDTAVSGRAGADAVEWGPYRPAIRRWERITGRRAPEPVIRAMGRRSGARLNPRFVEWMMGLPDGWVTDSGIAHNPQLKALGNGVVPQQAAAALRYLLTVEAKR